MKYDARAKRPWKKPDGSIPKFRSVARRVEARLDLVYVFEFKRDSTAAEALAQIEEKGYAKEYEADTRQLFKIGCNFSTETGTIDGWAVV